MAKIEVANTLFLVCFKTVFVFPEHCAFSLCEVLMFVLKQFLCFLNIVHLAYVRF